MNIAIYLLCLVLLLPAVFFAAFGLLIEGLTTWGLWEMIKILFSPLYDPFGKGIWVFLLFLASGGLLFAGFSDVARPYGFGSIAAIGVLSTLLIFRIYPGPWQWDNIFFLIPGAAAAFGSLYCLARPLR
ncbi:MAG TPA: hypothetical protein VFQ91_28095 [Bryobacteraceae bacterium]|nr:hypothetical protein [Bryobacteraceae bacterium]